MFKLLTRLLSPVASTPTAGFQRFALRRLETDATKESMVNPLFKNIPQTVDAPQKLNRRDNPQYSGMRVQFGSTGRFRYSPKKLNLIARQIRGLRVSEAILQMGFSPKGPAKRIQRMLTQTVTTAQHNQGFDSERLWVREAYVGKGLFLDRIRIHGKGRFGKMQHKFTHMKVVLEERPAPTETPQIERLKSILKKQKLSKLVTMQDQKPVFTPPPWSLRARIKPWNK